MNKKIDFNEDVMIIEENEVVTKKTKVKTQKIKYV